MFSVVGFQAGFNNSSDLVASQTVVGFGANGQSGLGEKKADHRIGLAVGSESTTASQTVTIAKSIASVLSSTQEYAKHCYSVMSFGSNENNAIGFGGDYSWSIGKKPTPAQINSKLYYDTSSLMLMSSKDSLGNVGAIGNLAVGNEVSLGAELVVNGDFTVGTGWTLPDTWSITGGQLSLAAGTTSPASQVITGLSAGRMYKIQYDLIGVGLQTNQGNAPTITIGNTEFPRKFEDGTYFHYFVADAGNTLVITPRSVGDSFQLDNISIKQCEGGDLSVGGDTVLGSSTTSAIGLFGVTPVTQPTALTAPNVSVPAGTDAAIIANLQTRLNELEAKLQALGAIG
jgi:hypothetical protein